MENKQDNSMDRDVLMEAVERGTLRVVRYVFADLISKDNICQDSTWFDYKLLIAAFEREHKGIINFLIDNNCRVEPRDKTDFDSKPLHYAVKLGDVCILRKILRKNASIFDKNSDQETPFNLALQDFKLAILDAMLTYYDFDNINEINTDNLALFHVACMRDKTKIINKFLNAGFPINSHANPSFGKYQDYTPLHFAVTNRNKTIVHYLLENNAEVCVKNVQGSTPLHIAFHNYSSLLSIKDIIFAMIQECIKNFLNPVDGKGVSHFHICCLYDLCHPIQFFLNHGVNVNLAISAESDKFPSYTPLHVAIEYNHECTVELLLKCGANVNAKCKKGWTPLHLACYNGYIGLVKLLLEFNADISIQDNEGRTPIHVAFNTHRESDIVDLLLSKVQKDVNFNDCRRLSHFHIACTRKNASTVEMFLKHGVSINSCVNNKKVSISNNQLLDEESYTDYSALHFAVAFNRKDVVLMLLKHGADVNINLGISKIKPLHLACMYNKRKFQDFINLEQTNCMDWLSHANNQIDIIKTLINYKANVNAQDSCGKTPLIYTCEVDIIQLFSYEYHIKKPINDRLITIIEILLSHNADINICTLNGTSLLHVISSEKRLTEETKYAELFLRKGININAADKNGYTALHKAVVAQKDELVKLLLRHRADINVVTNELMTPFHLAMKYSFLGNYKKFPIIESLLSGECDINMQNAKGEIPLHLVFSPSYSAHNIIELLLHKYGFDINSIAVKNGPPIENLYKASTMDIRRFMFIHTKKLDILGLHINEEIKNHFWNFFNDSLYTKEDSTWLKNIVLNCTEELEKLKNIRVDNYSTLYHILLKDEDEMTNHIKNQSFVSIVSSKNVEVEFPLYSYLLKLQFNKGKARYAILEPAKEALDFITSLSWPESCSEQILRYLNKKNLENLIQAKDVKIAQKRKLVLNTVENDKPNLTKHPRLE